MATNAVLDENFKKNCQWLIIQLVNCLLDPILQSLIWVVHSSN